MMKDGRNALCPGVEWQWTLSHSLGCECDLTDLKINSSLWIQWVLKRYGNLDLPAVASLPVAQDRQAETSQDVRGHAVGEIGIYVERRFYPSSSWSGQGPEWALLVRVEGKILRSSSPLGSGWFSTLVQVQDSGCVIQCTVVTWDSREHSYSQGKVTMFKYGSVSAALLIATWSIWQIT